MLVAPMPQSQVIKPFDDLYTTDTGWHIVGMSGAGYASLAALQTAGDTPFPSLPGGSLLSSFNVRSLATGGILAGSDFQIAYNTLVAPTKGDVCAGTAQNLTLPGMVYNVWIQKTVASDIVRIAGWG